MLITLTDHTICAGMDAIIKLCNQSGITLFTSELDSNDKGAALSYGIKEADYRKESALKAYAILHDKVNAHTIPITSIKDFYLVVNPATAAAQHVTLSSELLNNPRIIINSKMLL